MVETKQTHFESIFQSGHLIDVKIYQVNKTYFEIPNPCHWFIDGGIEFTFPSNILTFGWSTDLDMFVFDSKKFEDLFKKKRFHLLTKDNVHLLHNLKDKTIKSMDWKWIPIQTRASKQSKFKEDMALLELNLNFSTNEKLQIAAADYDLTKDDDPKKYRRLLNAELLISLNHRFKL